MFPVFKTLGEIKVVGMSAKFISVTSPERNNHLVIPKLWQGYRPREKEIVHGDPEINLGVCMDIPKELKTHPEEMLYIAGKQVSSFDDVPGGMETFIIPASDYAVFTHKGPIETYSQTVMYIYGTWFPKSGKKMKMAPDFEYYDQRFKLHSTDSEVDIYVPIE